MGTANNFDIIEIQKKAKQYAIQYNLMDIDRYIYFFTYWANCAFCFQKSYSLEDIEANCKEMAYVSYKRYNVYRRWGHSHLFCEIVSSTLNIQNGIMCAYTALSHKERYKEALKEYRLRGFSIIYCQRIALCIGRYNFRYGMCFFENIEDKVRKYEIAFISEMIKKKPLWQVYLYANNVFWNEGKQADKFIQMLDKDFFELPKDWFKYPKRLLSLIFPYFDN